MNHFKSYLKVSFSCSNGLAQISIYLPCTLLKAIYLLVHLIRIKKIYVPQYIMKLSCLTEKHVRIFL